MTVIPDTNFMEGRDGERVELAIVHWTTGTAESALAHFRNPTTHLSAHYIIDRDGTRIPVLPETDTAFHAGNMTVNLRSVGIEFVGGEAWGNTFTDAQYAEGSRLLRELSARYGFPLDAQHIRPHRSIVATQCPGTLNVARLLEEEVTEEEVREIAKAECRAVLSKEAWLADMVDRAVRKALEEASRRLAA